MNPRERFELGLLEAREKALGMMNDRVNQILTKIYGPALENYRPNDMLQTHFDGEKLNVTVIPREQVYFDSTHAEPASLVEYTAKAKEQNATVLWIFQVLKRPLSPSQVLSHWPWISAPPITSVRRSMTVLTDSGALVKTDQKRKGLYNRPEFVWRLPEGVQHG